MILFQLSHAAEPIQVDDGYTVSKRFEKYRKLDTTISLPKLSFTEGQLVEFDLRYAQVGQRELHLDLFHAVPNKPSKGLIIFIHGGGWRAGNKSHFYPLANLLAQQGYNVALPEYRLSIAALYPAAVDDIEQATQWLLNHSSELGISTSPLIIGGGSSGGHLATLIGFKNNKQAHLLTDKPIPLYNAVINLDGLLDVTSELALKFENRKGNDSALAKWLGGRYETIPDLWHQVSPVNYINEDAPELLIISSGQARFTAGKDKTKRLFNENGRTITIIEHENIIHTFWLFEPYLTNLAADIAEFLMDVSKIEQE
ncbi:alpha/beta hydrolase [Psychrosphaera aquimarina]|uniref:Alpha/beta hydrolase n=1 Tax=Psychrosphaera aquimarina TaxID=2044854 RepID=A0ABU3R3Z5_9GAMM|nr:alpha/beta hydrolase [Psychrosphaera aquimarina]MDU0114391.1 alpha/beta hydrolase [Psychrosphaera aquimarina]